MAETSDWTDDFLAWADNKQATISFVDYIDKPPKEIWRFNLSIEEIDVDQVTKELLRFAQELKPGTEFTLDVKRSYLSWGADASAFEVVLAISSLVLSAVPVIEKKMEQLRKRLGSETRSLEPLDREEAVRQAKHQVVMSYGLKHDQLTVVAEEEDRQSNTWTIELHGEDEGRYTVVIGSVGGFPSTYRIKRDGGRKGKDGQ